VSLIKSIPEEYFAKVAGAVARSISSGNGLQDLTAFFAEQDGVEARRAKNIAIDQTHKAYNGLNAERMKRQGVGKYEWVHSGGGLHPRPLHQSYHGRIFSFDKPPVIDERTGARGIPGQAINCRCTMVPVIEFEDGKPA
jgi:SPP1 gp7 family putative phage head morphogenesis protein